MTSLTEVSLASRKIIKITLILLVVFVAYRIGSTLILSYLKTAYPPQPPPPQMRFGKIQKLDLAEIKNSSIYTYKLETPTNTLLKLADRANIYYSPYSKPNLLALEKAKTKALLLGFRGQEKKLSEKTYQWKDKNKQSVLKIDIFNDTFSLIYNWQTNQNLIGNKLQMSEAEAIQQANKILNQTQLMPEDLGEENTVVTYMKISGQKLVPAVSLSEANFVKVDFYRMNIDDLPTKSVKADTGVIQVILTDSLSTNFGIIELHYAYYPIDYGSKSDYPIKNAATLWNEFSSGNGYIISEPKQAQDEVIIRRVYMGYLDTLSAQKFFQPVLFFQGDDGFLAFMPVLVDEVFY